MISFPAAFRAARELQHLFRIFNHHAKSTLEIILTKKQIWISRLSSQVLLLSQMFHKLDVYPFARVFSSERLMYTRTFHDFLSRSLPSRTRTSTLVSHLQPLRE
jgi:hypothetical protein